MNFSRGHTLKQEQTIRCSCGLGGKARLRGASWTMALSSFPWPRTLPCTSLPSSKKVSITNVVRSAGKSEMTWSPSPCFQHQLGLQSPFCPFLLSSPLFQPNLLQGGEASKLIHFLQAQLKMGDQEDGHWDSRVFVSGFGFHLQWDAASQRWQPKYLWKDSCEVMK